MPPKRRKPQHCFLSHSHYNKDFADKLAKVLADHAIEAWYAPNQIKGADQWYDEIGEALARCDWFLLVLSPSAIKAPYVKKEYIYAEDERRLVGRITPLLYRDCKWKQKLWTLRGVQWVDFRKDFDAGCRDLLAIWGIEYRPQ